MKLLNSHAIRPEGGHLHGGNVLAKVVVVQWLQSCEPIGKEVPYLIRRGPSTCHTLRHSWMTRLRGLVLALRDQSMDQTCSQVVVELVRLELQTGHSWGSKPCPVSLPERSCSH